MLKEYGGLLGYIAGFFGDKQIKDILDEIRVAERSHVNNYDKKLVNQSIVHTREDMAGVFLHISALNRQIWVIRRSLLFTNILLALILIKLWWN
ncbi:MAG: hypothetical protein EPN22_10440 [Nitrospirae bacterium]|nr:MAG: hypothetical protein EPN22_10440 [Nitrospirota bacterium]